MIQYCRNLAISLLGRRTAYRSGRALYQIARGEIGNDMVSNGEMMVQRCVVEAWLKDGIRENRLVIFDVGANVGDWSSAVLSLLTDSDTCDSLDLFVFEPVPSTFEFLRNRLGTHNPSLHYEQVALSSENGTGIINVNGENAGTNSMHAGSLGRHATQIAIVRSTAVDFCKANNIQKIHLLKCDTEGHDMEVIRGALPLLADGKIAVLQFEYNHRWIYARNFLRDAFTAVETLPYSIAKLQPDHLMIFAEWHPELERFFEGNYAFVRKDALKWFPTKKVQFDRFNSMSVGGA